PKLCSIYYSAPQSHPRMFSTLYCAVSGSRDNPRCPCGERGHVASTKDADKAGRILNLDDPRLRGDRIYLCTGWRLPVRRAGPLCHYANGNYECCGSNMADLETAADSHLLGPLQFSRDQCGLHLRLFDELVGDVDLQNGNETGLPPSRCDRAEHGFG